MIHFSNLWVNEMTKKDLVFLKSTLAEIRSEQKAILSIKTKIKKLEKGKVADDKTLRELKRKINRISKWSKTHDDWISEKKREIGEVKTKLKDNRELRSSRNLLIKNIKSEISELETQIEYTETKNFGITTMFFVLFTVIGFSAGMIYTSDFPRGEWICDDGTVIDLLDVVEFWGNEDCPDGSDEDIAVFGDSRAEDAKKSDEYTRLRGDIDGVISICVIIGIGFGFAPWRKIVTNRSPSIDSLNENLLTLTAEKEQLIKKRQSGDGIGKLETRLKKLKSELSRKTGEVSGLENLKNKMSESKHQINKNTEDLKILSKEIEIKEIAIQESWGKITHLIPYSESVELL